MPWSRDPISLWPRDLLLRPKVYRLKRRSSSRTLPTLALRLVGYLTGREHGRLWDGGEIQLHCHEGQVIAEVYAGAEIVDRAQHCVEHLARGRETAVETAPELLGAKAVARWGDG